MGKAKLHEILAVEKSVKPRQYSEITKLDRASKNPELYYGLSKTYTSRDEDGEQFPPEKVMVRMNVKDVIETVGKSLVELFDITATKDFGNTHACADIKLGDKVIMEKVPPTYLLFLEKQLIDINTMVSRLPELDPAEDWKEDKDSGLFKSEMRQTHKTKKLQKGIVLHAPTKEHPAQTQLITEDVTIGHWEQIRMSGAIPATRKKVILDRIAKLMKAVMSARAEANSTEVEHQKVGEEIVNYIFAE